MLDLLAGLLSGGRVTHEIVADPERETDLSQVFVAVDLSSFGHSSGAAIVGDEVIGYLQSSLRKGDQVRYPGENVLKIRNESLAKGIGVEPGLWKEIMEMR